MLFNKITCTCISADLTLAVMGKRWYPSFQAADGFRSFLWKVWNLLQRDPCLWYKLCYCHMILHLWPETVLKSFFGEAFTDTPTSNLINESGRSQIYIFPSPVWADSLRDGLNHQRFGGSPKHQLTELNQLLGSKSLMYRWLQQLLTKTTCWLWWSFSL